MEKNTDRVSTAERLISPEQQVVINSIPTRQFRGVQKPVPDLVAIARKLHYYSYGAKELEIFKAEIEAWKRKQIARA